MSNDKFNELSTEVASTENDIVFSVDADVKPHIKNFDDLVAKNERILADLNAYEYDGTETERKLHKKFIAAVRSQQKNLKQNAKEFESDFFSIFHDQLKQLNSGIDDIIDVAKSRQQESDDAFVAQRDELLMDYLEGVQVIDDCLEGVDLKLFIDKPLYNRSTTEKSAVATLQKRIDDFKNAVDLNVTPEWNRAKLLESLSDFDFNSINVIAQYNQEIKDKEEAEMLEAQRKAKANERRAKIESRTIVKLSIPNGQLDDMYKALDAAHIKYEVI